MSEELDKAVELLAALVDGGDRALNVKAAAVALGVPVGTFRQLAAKPGFPVPAKMGRLLTWRRRELLAWWEAERERQRKGRKAA